MTKNRPPLLDIPNTNNVIVEEEDSGGEDTDLIIAVGNYRKSNTKNDDLSED